MKRCPQCNRIEADDALAFCRADGTLLVRDNGTGNDNAGPLKFSSVPEAGEPETCILPIGEAQSRPVVPTTVLDERQPSANKRELRKPKSSLGLIIAAAAVITVAVAGAYLYLGRGRSAAAKNSIAVVPFQNASNDPNMEYLSDGISESLINSLSQLPNVRVLARSTMFRFKGKDADPQQVGKQLGVDAVLTGRIVQVGDSLSVQADLVSVSDGSQMWGDQYKRKAADILAVQEDISREIMGRLRPRLSGEQQERMAKRQTDNPEAYQLYLRGRFYWNKRTEEDIRKGIGFFQQAIERDPNFALAYVGVADSYILLSIPDALTGAMQPQEALPKARAAAERALEIDNSLAEAQAALSQVKFIDGDWNGAEEGLRHSIELNPNYANAHHWRALNLSSLGQHDEALREIRRALELDPLSPPINTNVAFVLFFARRYDEAIEQCRKTLDMDPNFALAHKRLGTVYEQQRLYGEAIAEFRQAADYSNQHPNALAALAHALAASGDMGGAQKALGELTGLAGHRYISSYDVAVVYAGLGEKEEAFRWLERAVEQHDFIGWLKLDPRLDALRADPRFQELMRRVGLPQ